MPASGPNFSPYPFECLRRTTRADAAFESALARHLASGGGAKLTALVGAAVHARVVGVSASAAIDPYAARAELRVAGTSVVVTASGAGIRALAARWLGGPDELAAPRPLTPTEHAIWCLVLAAALADLGSAASVVPLLDEPLAIADARAVELAVTLGDEVALAVVALVPRALALRVPAPRPYPPWTFEVPVVLGRAAVPPAALAALAPGDIITVERLCALAIGDGDVHLTARAGAVEATVATGYVPRDMAMPDDAHLELSVQLGTTRLSLRQLAELAVGQVIPLGRPLAGPFEVRAAGRVVGQGELIDIDGELGVRIVSLAQE